MTEIGKKMEIQTGSYTDTDFVKYVTASLLKSDRKMKVCSLQTGTGKSFIAFLLAFYLMSMTEKVAIVTSKKHLVAQLREMLGHMRNDVDIITMKEAICSYE